MNLYQTHKQQIHARLRTYVILNRHLCFDILESKTIISFLYTIYNKAMQEHIKDEIDTYCNENELEAFLFDLYMKELKQLILGTSL